MSIRNFFQRVVAENVSDDETDPPSIGEGNNSGSRTANEQRGQMVEQHATHPSEPLIQHQVPPPERRLQQQTQH